MGLIAAILSRGLTLFGPTVDGSAGDVMETDGAGNLVFVTPGGGGLADGHAILKDQGAVQLWTPSMEEDDQRATSGTGGVSSVLPRSLDVSTGTTAGSSGATTWANGAGWSAGQLGKIDWDKKISFAVALKLFSSTTNGQCWIRFGGSSGGAFISDFSMKAIGFRIDDDALKGIADTGSAQDITDLAITLDTARVVVLVVVSDGAGNIEYFANDDGAELVSVGTSMGGPTGLSANASLVNPGAGAANNADSAQQHLRIQMMEIAVTQ